MGIGRKDDGATLNRFDTQVGRRSGGIVAAHPVGFTGGQPSVQAEAVRTTANVEGHFRQPGRCGG